MKVSSHYAEIELPKLDNLTRIIRLSLLHIMIGILIKVSQAPFMNEEAVEIELPRIVMKQLLCFYRTPFYVLISTFLGSVSR